MNYVYCNYKRFHKFPKTKIIDRSKVCSVYGYDVKNDAVYNLSPAVIKSEQKPNCSKNSKLVFNLVLKFCFHTGICIRAYEMKCVACMIEKE